MIKNQQHAQQSNQYATCEDEIDLRDLIRILWNRKWLVIVSAILCVCLALGFTMILKPVYQADGKIALGNTGHEMYTSAASAQEVFLSRDMMRKVVEKFDLKNEETGEYLDVEKFKENFTINPIGNTRLIQIQVRHTDPETAQGIARFIREEFIAQSEETFLEKKKLIEELYQQYIERFEQISLSLEQNKRALTAIETNQGIGAAEKDLARARLIDYVTKDENTLNTLESQIRDVQIRLLDMEGAKVFETAVVPQVPISPHKILNLAIGLVFGVMVGIFAVFVLEYFKNTSLNLNKK